MNAPRPTLSVIVPCYNAAWSLDRCLEALTRSTRPPLEILVVDDGSTDDSAAIAQRHPVTLIRNGVNRGAAFARNEGARRGRGDVLVFLDADVVVRPDTLARITSALEADGADTACAIYARDTPLSGIGPRLGTLFDHYYYHAWPATEPRRRISCFLAYCGAVRRDVFVAAGGFDERIPGAGAEDYAFGRALRRVSTLWQYRDIDVVHLRRGILRRGHELFHRSRPFLAYFLATRSLEQNDSSVNGREIGCTVAMLGASTGLIVSPILPAGLVLAAASYGAFLVLNARFFRFVHAEGGPALAAAAVPAASYVSACLGWGLVAAAFRLALDRVRARCRPRRLSAPPAQDASPQQSKHVQDRPGAQ